MACQECSRKNCAGCSGPRNFFSFHYKNKIRKTRRCKIYEKRIGKYYEDWMIGCEECGENCARSRCEFCET